MKIGTFAKTFNTTKDTIRHYTEKFLLNPVKVNNFYDYGDSCIRDMKIILKLKELDFSLDEITYFLSFVRNSFNDMIIMEDELFNFMNEKINCIEEKIMGLNRSKDEIEHYMALIKEKYDNVPIESKKVGIPSDFIEHLFCPRCQRRVYLASGEIENGEILNGAFRCHCGYSGIILDGIIVVDGAYKDKELDENLKKMKTHEIFPPELTGIITSSSNWIAEKLCKENLSNKFIFDSMTHGGIRSLQLIEKLMLKEENFYYIANDIHYPHIRNFKALLSAQKKRPKTIFMCGNFENLPLKKDSFDFLISFFGLQTYSIYKKEIPVNIFSDFLKPDGKWFEMLFYTDKRGNVLDDYKHIKYFGDFDYIKEKIAEKWRLTCAMSGTTYEKGELSIYFKEDAPLSFLTCIGQKK